MTPTRDDMHPHAIDGARDWVATAKVVAKVIAIIAGAVGVHHSATDDGAARAQAAKNKAEAGYQLTREAMEELQHRVLVLEQAARAIQASPTPPPRRGVRRPPTAAPVPVAVTGHPKALPADLDKAERQVYRAAPPNQAKGPDASDR